jgi:hypothetical protein
MLMAYDAAWAAVADDPHDLEAEYVAALALARTGALDRAAQLAETLQARAEQRNDLTRELRADVRALGARIAKDRALRAPVDERAGALTAAADRYEAVAETFGGHYPLVNAATLHLLAADRDRAGQLAIRALDAIATDSSPSDYWTNASTAEASLILGDRPAAARALARAVAAPDADLAARAATGRQLALIGVATDVDVGLVDLLALPKVIHYCGHVAGPPDGDILFTLEQQDRLAAEISHYLTSNGVSIAYGSLASGADLLVAEAVLALGAELRVVLPFGPEEFVDVSVRPAGSSWTRRFERCLAAATDVVVACDSAYGGDDELFGHASRIAMGFARNRASMLATSARQLAIWDGQPSRGLGGTADNVDEWRRAGGTTHVIDVATSRPAPRQASDGNDFRTVRAFIFADLHGFSLLRDEHFPVALSAIFSPLGEVLDRHAADVLSCNTWGDALQAVLTDAPAAARCALDLQDAVRDVDARALGLPADLGMRVAVHVGPAMRLRDPLRRTMGWWGRELTRTARIEPRTPEGEVYATEQFAALLVLEPDSGISCEYVGQVTTAKDFETIPMYRIGRSARDALAAMAGSV